VYGVATLSVLDVVSFLRSSALDDSIHPPELKLKRKIQKIFAAAQVSPNPPGTP